MSVTLSQNSYGKSSVRVAKITRHADYHDFKEVSVNMQLTGEFEKVYKEGDNTPVLPTDTMKNTVYALAKNHPLKTIEEFGLTLAQHFLDHNPQVSGAAIELHETLWQRTTLTPEQQNPTPHPHAFMKARQETWTSSITNDRKRITVKSGLKHLVILKTTDSGFSNFLHDRFTTLQDADDRIFATDLQANWLYHQHTLDFAMSRQTVRQILLETFAQHHSLSVQHTLYAMGEAVLEKCPEVEEIDLVMPNKHYLLFDLNRFGMENRNEIFIPTDEPFGRIAGTLRRDRSKPE